MSPENSMVLPGLKAARNLTYNYIRESLLQTLTFLRSLKCTCISGEVNNIHWIWFPRGKGKAFGDCACPLSNMICRGHDAIFDAKFVKFIFWRDESHMSVISTNSTSLSTFVLFKYMDGNFPDVWKTLWERNNLKKETCVYFLGEWEVHSLDDMPRRKLSPWNARKLSRLEKKYDTAGKRQQISFLTFLGDLDRGGFSRRVENTVFFFEQTWKLWRSC